MMKMTKVSDLFTVIYGHSLELNRLERTSPDSGIAFVSRQMGNNAISAYVQPIDGLDPANPGELSVALGGNGVLTTCLQEQPYYTGRDVARLIPKSDLSKNVLLYYCACIKANRFRYSYGRQANRTLKDIAIPSLNDIPNFVHAQALDVFNSADKPLSSSVKKISPESWQYFKITDLFELRKGQRLTKANMRPGTTKYIGASDANNGVTALIGQEPTQDGNTITVSYNGSVAEAFYQPEAYWGTDDVNVLCPKFPMNQYNALFICTILRKEKHKYNYGRKWHLERMSKSEIKLPINKKGKPDFVFMENYIKSLPFSSSI